MTDADYPYKGATEEIFDGKCHYDKTKGGINVIDYKMVPPNNANCLRNAIREAPVSVAVQASTWHFKLYEAGVIRSEKCGTDVDHNLTAVGFGSEDGTIAFYWLKNSWGRHWGDNGYVKVAVEDNGPGICGVQSRPISVITN